MWYLFNLILFFYGKKSKKSTQGGKREEELKIFDQNLGNQFKADLGFLEKLLVACPFWLPAGICYRMWDALSGYSNEMQNVMVCNLTDFLWGSRRKLTGIDHVDEQLLHLYEEIFDYAQANDFGLGCSF